MSTELTKFEEATQAAIAARGALEAREEVLKTELAEIHAKLGRKRRTTKAAKAPKVKGGIEAREQA